MTTQNNGPRPLSTRREFTWQLGAGLTGLALADLLACEGYADDRPNPELNGGIHHRAKVRRVIQLFMNGGTAHMDTWDYRPMLQHRPERNMLSSPFAFRQHGRSGHWVSSVFPHQARFVDDLCFLHAMHTDNSVHGLSSYMMNTGFARAGYPCLGSWVSYGMGRLSDNLPSFVVLPDKVGMPYNGEGNFSSGFLSSEHSATIIQAHLRNPIADLRAADRYRFVTPDADRDGLTLLQRFNREHRDRHPADTRLDARIASYEMAARMQISAPEAFDLSRETEATKRSYGIGTPISDDVGTRCLLARRLIERGVRFVQVWSGHDGAGNNWDNHGDIAGGLKRQADKVDQPIAGLIQDLKQRGLLEDTLLLWATEFGRTAMSQGSGRDHNGNCFTVWLAGAGVKAGYSHGQSDAFGARAAIDTTTHHDYHATVLHLLGIDHTRLTFLHNGFNRRLTDVHGEVIREILA